MPSFLLGDLSNVLVLSVIFMKIGGIKKPEQWSIEVRLLFLVLIIISVGYWLVFFQSDPNVKFLIGYYIWALASINTVCAFYFDPMQQEETDVDLQENIVE